jgi:hypothetical protein
MQRVRHRCLLWRLSMLRRNIRVLGPGRARRVDLGVGYRADTALLGWGRGSYQAKSWRKTACWCCDREGSVQPVMDKIIGKRVFRIVGERVLGGCARVL